MYAEATLRQLESLGVKGNLLRSCIANCKDMPFKVSIVQSGKHDRKVSGRNRSIQNRAPVEGHINLGGGGGDERDQGGGARRAQKRGEG